MSDNRNDLMARLARLRHAGWDCLIEFSRDGPGWDVELTWGDESLKLNDPDSFCVQATANEMRDAVADAVGQAERCRLPVDQGTRGG
jgi:hypothetical protein